MKCYGTLSTNSISARPDWTPFGSYAQWLRAIVTENHGYENFNAASKRSGLLTGHERADCCDGSANNHPSCRPALPQTAKKRARGGSSWFGRASAVRARRLQLYRCGRWHAAHLGRCGTRCVCAHRRIGARPRRRGYRTAYALAHRPQRRPGGIFQCPRPDQRWTDHLQHFRPRWRWTVSEDFALRRFNGGRWRRIRLSKNFWRRRKIRRARFGDKFGFAANENC